MLFSLSRYLSVYLMSLLLDLFTCYQKLVQQLDPHTQKNKKQVSLLFSFIWQKSKKTAISRKFCEYSYNFNQWLILKRQTRHQNLVCVFLQFYLLHLCWLWRRKWHPTPVFLPGEFHGQRSLVGYSPWGCKESDTTEQLSFILTLFSVNEENKNLLT